MPDYKDCRFSVSGVRSIHNAPLRKQYDEAKKKWAKEKGGGQPMPPDMDVYHGTHTSNVEAIATNNISMAKKGKLDPGWFGAGLYFSKHADYCFMYCQLGGKLAVAKAGQEGRLLRFRVMPGRINQLSELATGKPQKEGFDSNVSPEDFELVLFQETLALPTHIIDFKVEVAKGSNFNQSVEKKGPHA